MAKKKTEKINNIVFVSDTHSGCGLALMPPDGVVLDTGGEYHPSRFQRKLWAYWREFWDVFVPDATRGEPYCVVHVGDALDGVHHGSTYQITHNLTDQSEIAYQILKPVVDLCAGRYYHIRGTEAHVGKSAQEEEALAKRLGAVKDQEGRHSRYDLWIMCGPKLIHALHHIGTTGSQAYEATAVHKELVESFTEAARWSERPPDLIVRGHRHRYIKTEIATTISGEVNHAAAVVLPAFQGKTPFAWKVAGARLSPPQFGGVVARYAHGEFFTRAYVRTIQRGRVEG